MANQYKNKVIYNNNTIIDISDTTAIASDVAEGKYFYLASGERAVGSAVTPTANPKIDLEWQDVYSAWQAGYYYDPSNDYTYTQIPSSATSWDSTGIYVNVSCTPYSSLIPVKEGEKWKYSNAPVYLDSLNDFAPSVIIFDSNKQEIESYSIDYENTSIEFTIPQNGVWMAILFNSTEECVLQKYNINNVNKEEVLNNVFADYRIYNLTAPPTLKTLTKGYICFGTDDLKRAQTKSLHNFYTSNNIPYYMAVIPNNIGQCVPDDPYKTNKDYMDLCVAAGGEIICHSAPFITEQNKNDFNTMYQYFVKNKEQIEYYGFDVKGIFKAGGTNSIYNVADPVIDAWATHYYKYGDYFTTNYPYYTTRIALDDWSSSNYSELDNIIQNICENHTYVIFMFHEYNATAETTMARILSKLSNYTKGTDYDFVTPSQLYDLLMPTSRPTGGSAPITYTLSMSGNVITLTPSSGTASSITLPVYNGGVT